MLEASPFGGSEAPFEIVLQRPHGVVRRLAAAQQVMQPFEGDAVAERRVRRGEAGGKRALGHVEAWPESPTLVVLSENDHHFDALRDLAVAARVSRAGIHDAMIAVLCRSHGVREIWSADRDLSRFKPLTSRNPLV